MIIKILGCILIIASSTAAGINKVSALKKRIYALCGISELMNLLKIKITYELCDIPNALILLADKYPLAKKCVIHIKDGKSLKDAWNSAVYEFGTETCLKEKDLNILEDFCVCLGETDIEGQISNFDMFIELVKKSASEAQAELNSRIKIILSTSTFTGILISILLI